jgi:dethiobiotin synthetase
MIDKIEPSCDISVKYQPYVLSVEALKSRNIPVEGIIFNGISNASTEHFILNYTKLKCLGRIPTQAEIDKPAVRKLADSLVGNWQ